MFPHLWSHLLGSAPLYIWEIIYGKWTIFSLYLPQAGSALPSQLTEFPKLFSWHALWFFSSLRHRGQNCLIRSPCFSFWMSAMLSHFSQAQPSPRGCGAWGTERGLDAKVPWLLQVCFHRHIACRPGPFGFLLIYFLNVLFVKCGHVLVLRFWHLFPLSSIFFYKCLTIVKYFS